MFLLFYYRYHHKNKRQQASTKKAQHDKDCRAKPCKPSHPFQTIIPIDVKEFQYSKHNPKNRR